MKLIRRHLHLSQTKRMSVMMVVTTSTLSLIACQRPAPAGQVLASVGGKDVTLQDVRAEGRADGVSPNAGAAADVALLQRVVDRQLLAQSAHAQKLDQTAEAPSDLARLQQAWLADKAAKRILAGMGPPSDAEAQAFIAQHPYAFAKRERVTARTITIAAAPALLTQLRTYNNYDQALAFLKRLGVSLSTGVGQIDTSQLSPDAAAQVTATPIGTMIITQPQGRIQLAEIQSRTPLVISTADQLVLAKQSLASEAASKRIGSALEKLKAATPVTYQKGYSPPAKPSAGLH